MYESGHMYVGSVLVLACCCIGHWGCAHHVELILQDSVPRLIHIFPYALALGLLPVVLRKMVIQLVAQCYIYPL